MNKEKNAFLFPFYFIVRKLNYNSSAEGVRLKTIKIHNLFYVAVKNTLIKYHHSTGKTTTNRFDLQIS